MAAQAPGHYQPVRHGFRREEAYKNLLLDITLHDSDTPSQRLAQEITLREILLISRRHGSRDHNDTVPQGTSPVDVAPESMGSEHEWAGILPEEDILRFALSSPRYELAPKTQQRLEDELNNQILTLAEFFHADVDWENLGEDERTRLTWALPETIESFKGSIESIRSEVEEAYGRIDSLVKLVNETHTHLQTGMSTLVAKHSSELNSKRLASNEFLAARIEASLIKLSLIRARATRALYDHRSSKDPDATVTQALSVAYKKLKADERKMREEGLTMDQQLAEYATMLKLVDGSGGGFAQVIEDWTRVQKEKDECMRDLRRLGWTGD